MSGGGEEGYGVHERMVYAWCMHRVGERLCIGAHMVLGGGEGGPWGGRAALHGQRGAGCGIL